MRKPDCIRFHDGCFIGATCFYTVALNRCTFGVKKVSPLGALFTPLVQRASEWKVKSASYGATIDCKEGTENESQMD
jgi:hypothetical protein